uniref:Uncharacterized protein n=1 Tax=Rhodopseudomonas palustris (strain BisA53) TaxID=316055 RepID=Q07SW7_RHOP5
MRVGVSAIGVRHFQKDISLGTGRNHRCLQIFQSDKLRKLARAELPSAFFHHLQSSMSPQSCWWPVLIPNLSQEPLNVPKMRMKRNCR